MSLKLSEAVYTICKMEVILSTSDTSQVTSAEHSTMVRNAMLIVIREDYCSDYISHLRVNILHCRSLRKC